MRNKCPMCKSPERYGGVWKMQYLVPDGWSLPTESTVYLCMKCGLVYYDNDATQADYDKYYKERYGYDGNLHNESNFHRLDELVQLVTEITDKYALIVDFGGGEGYLTNKLNEMGYARAVTVNVGEPLPDDIDVIVASHVFEHLYDVRGIVGKLSHALKSSGKFVVEVPDEYLEPTLPNPVPILDYHQKHINHFAPYVLDDLMTIFGWHRTYHHSAPTPWYFGYHYRAVYELNPALEMYLKSMLAVKDMVAAKVEKLKQVVGPVIVWGCGDYALHMLTKVKLDVAYYVDRDPAFIGATIGGVPVTQMVTSGEPIVIMAQNQQSGILHCIEQEGLKNRVIVI
jgi:SAM-dependent methyltransferase